MKGWTKLGDLLDKKRNENPAEVQPQGERQGLMARLGQMVAGLEKRIAEAFNRGQVQARRFNGADIMPLPQTQLEEVKEEMPVKTGMSVGRFDHVYHVRLPEMEEVISSDEVHK